MVNPETIFNVIFFILDQSDVQQSGANDSSSPTRTNPFSEEAGGAPDPKDENSEADTSGFKAMYVVRFIGCKQVNMIIQRSEFAL